MPTARKPTTLSRYLRSRLYWAGSAAVLLVGLGMFAYLWQARSQTLALRLTVTAELSADHIAGVLEHHLGVIELLALDPPDRGGWQDRLAAARQRFDLFVTMMVVDRDGRVITGVPERSPNDPRFRWRGLNVSDRDYFAEVVARRTRFLSNGFLGRAFDSEPIVALSAPVLGPDGEVQDVVEGSIEAASFSRLRAEALRKHNQSLLVVDADNRVVFASPGLEVDALDRLAPTAAEPTGSLGLLRLPSIYGSQGDAFAASASTRFGWRVLVLMPASDYRAEFQRDAVKLLVPALLALAAVLWAAHLLARQLAEPIGRLAAHMRAFAVAHRPQAFHAPGAPNELQELGESFNQLGQALSGAIAQTRDALAAQQRLAGELEATVHEREQEIERRTEQLRQANAELAQQSVTDSLTGVLNHRGFREQMDTLWRNCEGNHESLTAIALDVDHFKAYNDRYGHPAGDTALRRVAGAMRAVLTDGRDVLGRIGGEEFVALVPGLTRLGVQAAGERLRAAVEQLGIPHRGADLGRVTISVGVAVEHPHTGGDPGSLLNRADEALYRAKQAGRNRVSE